LTSAYALGGKAECRVIESTWEPAAAKSGSRLRYADAGGTFCEVYGVCNRGVRHVIGHPAHQTPPGSGFEGLGEVGDDVVEGRTLTVR
jgi:hypothetical protein